MTIETLNENRATPAHKGGHANRWVLGILGLFLLGGAAWYLRSRKPDAAAPAGAAAAAADRVVPVLVATVARVDVPIYLEGLGNVLPLATVNVRSQVDGKLESVLFKEGQKVRRGELLAQVDSRPFLIQLHTGEAALARDNAQLRNAKLNLERFKTLREQSLIPQQQVDDQQTMVDQNDATVKSDQTTVDTAKLQLDYARIVSPIDGVTGVRQVDSGNLVHASDATGIVIITQLDPIAVLFTLPEDVLPSIAKQLALGVVAVDAYSRDGLTKLGSGTLTLIDNQINQTTATVRLKAQFPNGDKTLWPNQFVKTRLLLKTRKDALVVPSVVVQRGPQGAFAYVVGADSTVQMRPIEVETTEGESSILTKGLAPGEVVVADGQNQLRPGSKVAPRTGDKPGAAPSGSTGSSGRAAGSASAHAPKAP